MTQMCSHEITLLSVHSLQPLLATNKNIKAKKHVAQITWRTTDLKTVSFFFTITLGLLYNRFPESAFLDINNQGSIVESFFMFKSFRVSVSVSSECFLWYNEHDCRTERLV